MDQQVSLRICFSAAPDHCRLQTCLGGGQPRARIRATNLFHCRLDAARTVLSFLHAAQNLSQQGQQGQGGISSPTCQPRRKSRLRVLQRFVASAQCQRCPG